MYHVYRYVRRFTAGPTAAFRVRSNPMMGSIRCSVSLNALELWREVVEVCARVRGMSVEFPDFGFSRANTVAVSRPRA